MAYIGSHGPWGNTISSASRSQGSSCHTRCRCYSVWWWPRTCRGWRLSGVRRSRMRTGPGNGWRTRTGRPSGSMRPPSTLSLTSTPTWPGTTKTPRYDKTRGIMSMCVWMCVGLRIRMYVYYILGRVIVAKVPMGDWLTNCFLPDPAKVLWKQAEPAQPIKRHKR